MKNLIPTIILLLFVFLNINLVEAQTFSPVNGATDVSVSPILSITFDENVSLVADGYIYVIDEDTDWSTAIYLSTGVTGVFSPPPKLPEPHDSRLVISEDGKTLTIDLSNDLLQENKKYYVITTENALKAGSNYWNELYDSGFTSSDWSFTTGEAPAPLYTFSPLDGSIDVSVSPVLSIAFSDIVSLEKGGYIYVESDIDSYTFSTGKGRNNIPDDEISVDGNVLYIDLSDFLLDYSSTYTVSTEENSIKVGSFFWNDLDYEDEGNTLWSFTTEEESASLSVISFTPSNDASEVSISDNILEIEFNDDISLGSSDKYLYIYEVNGPPIPIDYYGATSNKVSVNGNTLQVDISDKPLKYDTKYYITLANDFVIGYSGFNDDSTWSFTTEEEPDDVLKAISFTPADGATEVPVKNNTLIIEFNGPISKGDGSKVLRIHRKSDGDLLVGIFANQSSVTIVDETKLEVDISSTVLKYITEYYITIDDGFVIGYSGISDNNTWTFTTDEPDPEFDNGYPIISQEYSGYKFKMRTNVYGNVYYVITTSPTPPTKANIIAGKNGSGVLKTSYSEAVEAELLLETALKEYGNLVNGDIYFLHAVIENNSQTKTSDIKTIIIDRKKPELQEDTRPVIDCDIYPVDGDIMLHFSDEIYEFDASEEIISALTKSSFDIKKGEESIDFSISVDGTMINLIPTDEFDENQEYTIVITNISDIHYNVVDEITRTFTTDMTNIWTGNVSSLWSDADNWSYIDGFVSGKSVKIQSGANSPVISSNVTVNNLTIEADALLEQTNGEVTVRGDLELLSSSTSNATYIPTGGSMQVVGETRVFQYIDNSLGLNVNYLIGTPTLGANNSNVESGYVIKKYNNTTNTWDAIGYDAMVPGVGYVAYALNDLVFKGDINRNSKSVNVTRTNGKGFGWNILANPYTASIDWDEMDNSELVENSYWLWHPSQKLYSTYNGELKVGTGGIDNIIPSNHAFIIKVRLEKEGGVFNFPMNARRPNKSNFLKSARSQYDHIKLSVSGNGATDQLAIAFAEDASVGIDKYDTEKYISSSSTVEIFSNVQSDKLSINTLPIKNEDQEVLLGYKSTKVGDYTLSIDKNSTGFDEITLLDLVESREVNILEESYSFSVTKNETVNNRFKLIFPASVSTPISVLDNDNFKVITDRNKVWIQVVPLDKAINYRIYTIQGQKIVNGTLTEGTNFVGSLTNGVYILQIESENNTIYREKLFLKE